MPPRNEVLSNRAPDRMMSAPLRNERMGVIQHTEEDLHDLSDDVQRTLRGNVVGR